MTSTPPPAASPQREPPAGLTWGAVIAVLDVFERDGFRKGDDQHTGRAIGRIQRAARIYAGLEDE